MRSQFQITFAINSLFKTKTNPINLALNFVVPHLFRLSLRFVYSFDNSETKFRKSKTNFENHTLAVAICANWLQMRLLARLWVFLWKSTFTAFSRLRWSSLVSAGCSLVFAGVRWCSLVFAGCPFVVRWCSLVFAEWASTAPFGWLSSNLENSHNFDRFSLISRNFAY